MFKLIGSFLVVCLGGEPPHMNVNVVRFDVTKDSGYSKVSFYPIADRLVDVFFDNMVQ